MITLWEFITEINMKNIDKELQIMGDKQHYIHDDVIKIINQLDEGYDKILETLKRIEKKMEKINAG
jgi:hypothetical protein